MKKLSILVLAIALVAVIASDSFAISKTARKYNFISFYSGYSQPVGTYDGLTFEKFNASEPTIAIEIDGKDIYESTFHVGFNYGNLIKKNLSLAFGLRYSKHKLKDLIIAEDILIDGELYDIYFNYNDFNLTLHQYDIEFDLNYLFADLSKQTFAPYVGAGVKAGLASTKFEGFETENDFTFNLNINFGAEMKVWKSNSKTDFITLASVNSFDLFANDNKPRYLNIGGALKYYFRP